jgi:hypothetical protein
LAQRLPDLEGFGLCETAPIFVNVAKSGRSKKECVSSFLIFENRVFIINSPSSNTDLMTQENVGKTPAAQASTGDLPFALSLIGGVLIAIGPVVGMGLAVIGRPFFWGMGGMMGYYNYPYMMGGYGSYDYYGVMYGLESVGIITGILVIVFAILMRSRPAERKTYGVLIIAFSLVSLVGMGGFFIGAIIGLVGGVLALAST